MFTILNVATGAKEKGIAASFAIGGFVGLAALFAGPLSGASMNPARSLAPALLSGQLERPARAGPRCRPGRRRLSLLPRGAVRHGEHLGVTLSFCPVSMDCFLAIIVRLTGIFSGG